MKRSVRRHQQRLARARRVRILFSYGTWTPLCRLLMNEPGWWVHDRVVAPARIRTHRLEHAVEQGRDPDALLWPDCKRPHDYYW
jgi:hypothetical protein